MKSLPDHLWPDRDSRKQMASFGNVWKWFVVLGRPIFQSEMRLRATGLLVLLVSLLLVVLNSSVTLLAFSGILWSITPWLFFCGAAYAALGSAVTILLGRRLLGLDVRQLKTEGDLRYELIQLRDQAAAEGLDDRGA